MFFTIFNIIDQNKYGHQRNIEDYEKVYDSSEPSIEIYEIALLPSDKPKRGVSDLRLFG